MGLVLDHQGHAPQHYIWIEEVVEGTPAGLVGELKAGDIVIAINGAEVRRLQMVDVPKLLVSLTTPLFLSDAETLTFAPRTPVVGQQFHHNARAAKRTANFTITRG